VLELKKRALKDTGRVLPGKFQLFLEPACLRPDYRVPMIWEHSDIHGVDFSFLQGDPLLDTYRLPGYGVRWVAASALDHFLCDPTSVLTVDLNEIEDASDIPSVLEFARPVLRAGIMDGLLIYFRVVFDDDIHFDTSPLHLHTSWGNRLLRTQLRHYAEGATVSAVIRLGDIRDSGTWHVSMA
jgi:type I protein arginine methyltransferase